LGLRLNFESNILIAIEVIAVEVPFKSLAVANRFIELGNESGNKLTLLKLLEVVYFAHGWHLALTDEKPLIDDTIEAWKFGPAAPTIYHSFKEYDSEPIAKLGSEADIAQFGLGTDMKDFVEKNIVDFMTPVLERSDFIDKFIGRIWEIYGSMSAIQLSLLTRQTGTPWHTIWFEKGGSKHKGTVIPDSLIANYFKGQLAPKSGPLQLQPAKPWRTTMGLQP
jgi:uncharacterized phage-associated protein